jgi:hypothetical protein
MTTRLRLEVMRRKNNNGNSAGVSCTILERPHQVMTSCGLETAACRTKKRICKKRNTIETRKHCSNISCTLARKRICQRPNNIGRELLSKLGSNLTGRIDI